MELEVISIPQRAELPITVRRPDGTDLKIARWKLEPGAGAVALSEVAAVELTALRTVAAMVAVRGALKPPDRVTDAPPRRLETTKEGEDEARALRVDRADDPRDR